ncbi:MAG: transporter [Gemmatimonadota bacterium]|nr:transporter [Gemmatimonadota bacterium]
MNLSQRISKSLNARAFALLLAVLGTVVGLVRPAESHAQVEWTASRPDGHAPIGVMGDHTHASGEWMLSYRFMHMSMEGNRDGTDPVSPQAIVDPAGEYDFMVTPTAMPMRMHMFGVMYAPSDRLTMLLMGNYRSTEMDHETRSGGTFTTEASGIGDARVGGLVGLVTSGAHRAHLNLGISAPLGSVEHRDVTPASGGEEVQLPYPMQLGSGTWDFVPGVTYLGMTDRWSWGAQALGTLRTGENDRGWTLGNELEATGWLALRATRWLSVSVRSSYSVWGDIDGEDPALAPNMVPTARTDLRSGRRLEVPVGLNLYAPDGPLAGHRVAIEIHPPVYQDLDGPQLETDWMLTVGWQKSFAPLGGHAH